MRGPGETEIETDRRIVKDKISLLRKRLGEIDKASPSPSGKTAGVHPRGPGRLHERGEKLQAVFDVFPLLLMRVEILLWSCLLKAYRFCSS